VGLGLTLSVRGQGLPPFPFPAEVMKPDWMEARKQLQLGSIGQFEVIHDFRFIDQVQASGITFENKIVDDAGKHHKAVHYDHGNGIAPADVDGDGLIDLYFTTQLGANGLVSSEKWGANWNSGRNELSA
jgi:hypothetical protein